MGIFLLSCLKQNLKPLVMKKYIIGFALSFITLTLMGQNSYSLKGSSLSFSSTDAYVNIYDNTDYALYKNSYVEVSIKKVSMSENARFETELLTFFDSKTYTVNTKNKLVNTTNQKALFYLGTKKGSKWKYAKGLIFLKKEKFTVFIDIKYDAKKEQAVKNLINSFYSGTEIPDANQVNLTSGENAQKSTANKQDVSAIKDKEEALLAENKRKEEDRKKAEAEAAKPAPLVDIPSVPEYNEPSGNKHPKVSHPNLIKLTAAQKQEFVNSHNRWRADVGVAPLSWSDDLENFAGEWAIIKGEEGCNMQHRPNNSYGENLYWSSGRAFDPGYTVDNWGSEIKDYNGEKTGEPTSGVVGHYTQMVWRNTTQVGCAAFTCGSTILVVCNYNPPGNYIGQHPYKK